MLIISLLIYEEKGFRPLQIPCEHDFPLIFAAKASEITQNRFQFSDILLDNFSSLFRSAVVGRFKKGKQNCLRTEKP